ncbi:MAG: hypothetical protein IPK60_05555 [Sandaracinaceae bacterium]|jgi:outer membrane protein assembly factor BamB|nr:hypothetical protein [Sandaracinaceae bacterium]
MKWVGGAVGLVVVVGLVVAATLTSTSARARPVRIGVYTEIARGVRGEHPCPTMRCDSRRTGQIKASAGAITQAIWRLPLVRGGGRGPSHLLSLEHGLLVANDSRGLVFVDSAGREQGRADVGALRETPAVTPSDEIALSTQTDDVVVVDLHGRVRARRREAAGPYSPTLMLADGTAVWSTSDHMVIGLSTSDLSDTFRANVPSLNRLLPVELDQDSFAVLSANSGLVLALSGVLVSTFSSSSFFRGSVSVSRNGVMWGPADDGSVVFVEPAQRLNGAARATLHVAEAPLIAADGSLRLLGVHEVVATDSRGNVLWTYADAGRRVVSAALDASATTLVLLQTATQSGRLVGLSAEGAEEWAVDFPERPLDAPPTLTDDGVVALLAYATAARVETPMVIGFH